MTITNNIELNFNFNYNNKNIDDLIKNNIIYRFTNEYNSLINQDDDNRKNDIEFILSKLNTNFNNNININNNDKDNNYDKDKDNNKDNDNKNKIKLLDDLIMNSNNLKYKQKWDDLNLDQKQFKIEEFVKNTDKIINKKKILNYLIENISTKKLIFIYNNDSCKITDIKKINGDEVELV